jgi:capsular exopolysaccharide synthesis family protein
MPSGNPIIRDLETAMDKQRNEMVAALSNAKESILLGMKEYQGKTKQANTEFYRVPGLQRSMLDIMRKQKIAEELYTFLLERKLETSIGSASTISSIQILEPGFSAGAPISPNTKGIYMFAFAIGLVFPVLVVFIKELLNDKIKNKSDLDVFTAVPVLGEVGHSESNKSLIITTSDRRFISEQFRILRTNLQYIFLKKQSSYVLLVTSSVSGEGKSFISTNMAAVMAVSGKKTVILEFDIRKPRVMQGLGMDYKRNKGISNYLVGSASLQEIIQQVPDMENLYVIPCGPIPPNPAELILSERLKQFFDEVRTEFEMVVVDTAPVGLVSDGYVLSQFSDASLYVVRHNFTLKQQIENIQMIYEAGKLPKMSLVINDVRALIGYGKYYGYVNYGNMSYGAEVSHYFDVTKRKGFIRFLRKIFGV